MTTPYSTNAAAHTLTQSRSAVLPDTSTVAVNPTTSGDAPNGHPLLTRLADGPRIQRVFDAFTVANAKRGFASANQQASDDLRATLKSPEFVEWMPRMGYKPLKPYGDRSPITAWLPQAHQSGTFIERMRTMVKITVTRPLDPMEIWSTVTQRIDLMDIQAALTALRIDAEASSVYDLPTLVAWAIHMVATTTLDFPWEITPTGIQRTLPPWPLRIPIGEEPRLMRMSDTKGTCVPCHAWVIDVSITSNDTNGPTLFLSVAGSPALLKMTKANWSKRSNRKLRHELPQHNGLGMGGIVNDNARWMGTTVSNAIHAVYIDERVLTPSSPHFYHITGTDGVPDWTLLFDQINRCLLIPIDYQDIESLWAAALSIGNDIVVPLKSYGCQGYRINVDCLHQWAIVIGKATGRSVTVNFVGRTETQDGHDDQLDVGDLAF